LALQWGEQEEIPQRNGGQFLYEPTRVFVIDESTVPDRIFHEKGANRLVDEKRVADR